MADIDKSLPNVARPEDEITEDIEIEEVEETGQGPVEITDEEDGGATIDFDPSQINIEEGGNHDANLSDLLPEDITDEIGGRYKLITKNTNHQEQIGKEPTSQVLIY